jgi:hypothetical protein
VPSAQARRPRLALDGAGRAGVQHQRRRFLLAEPGAVRVQLEDLALQPQFDRAADSGAAGVGGRRGRACEVAEGVRDVS